MTAAFVSFTEAELAEVLGMPLEAAKERVRARVVEGAWRLASPVADEPGHVVLTASQLNDELDAIQGDGGRDRDPARIAELTGLLRQAEEWIEEAGRRQAELTDANAAAKRALIAAYDKILGLQQQLAEARDSAADAREARRAVEDIASILERMRKEKG